MNRLVGKLLYQDGYKYRTACTYAVPTPFTNQAAQILAKDGSGPWVRLRQDGALIVREGYAWDGASGPTIDTKSSMIPSLVHDCLYQLSRAGKFDAPRSEVDDFFETLCLACGMWRIRAKLWRFGLKIGAKYAYERASEKLLEAP